MPSATARRSRATSASSASTARRRSTTAANGARSPSSASAAARRSRAPRSVLERRLGRRRGRSMGVGVGEDRLLGEEPLVLAVVGEPGRLDLVELEAQEVALALAGRRRRRPSASSVARRRSAGPPGRLEVVQVDAGEAVERPALARGGEQPDVGVLAVEVDEAGGQLGELRRGDEAAVAVGAGAPGAGHDPGEDDLVAVDDEPALDGGLVGARVAPPTASARSPASSPMAPTSIVLPAPVSPVRAVIPGSSRSVTSSITPRSLTASSASTAARPVGCGDRERVGGRFEGMRSAAVVEVARRRAPLVRIGGQRKGWAQGEEVSHAPPCGGTQPRMPQPPRRPDLQGARGIVVSAVVGYHALRLVLDRQGGDWGDLSPMWLVGGHGTPGRRRLLRPGRLPRRRLVEQLPGARGLECRGRRRVRPSPELADPPAVPGHAGGRRPPGSTPDVLAGDRAWRDVARLITAAAVPRPRPDRPT